jgi:hypothetical protein
MVRSRALGIPRCSIDFFSLTESDGRPLHEVNSDDRSEEDPMTKQEFISKLPPDPHEAMISRFG